MALSDALLACMKYDLNVSCSALAQEGAEVEEAHECALFCFLPKHLVFPGR